MEANHFDGKPEGNISAPVPDPFTFAVSIKMKFSPRRLKDCTVVLGFDARYPNAPVAVFEKQY
ncbi:hypothetical protein D3C81_2123510 [compost metagenome]